MEDTNAGRVGPDRSGMLDRYNEAMGLPKVEASVPATVVPPVTESSVGAPAETPAESVVTDTSTNKQVEKHEEDNKVVPLQALHEAREKLKAKTLDHRKLSEDLAAERKALADARDLIVRLEAKLTPEGAEPENEVTKQLAEENRKLKEAHAKSAAERQAAEQAKSAAEMQKMVSDADASLAGEGFPGFKRFTVDVGNAIIAKIQAGDMDEKDVNPTVWAKVYKEEVYPSIKTIFAAQVKQEKVDAKNQQKKDMSLINKPGDSPAPKEELDMDMPQTAETYLAARKRLH